MTTIPEYRITLHAPEYIINRYFDRCMYAFLFYRQIMLPGGYISEEFEGERHFIAAHWEVRQYIETIFRKLRECRRGVKTCNLVLYVFMRQDRNFLERWVFEINTDFCGPSHAAPTLAELIKKVREQLRVLPLLKQGTYVKIGINKKWN